MNKLKKIFLTLFLILLIIVVSIGTFSGSLLYNIIIYSNSSKNSIYAEYIYKATYSNRTWLLRQSNLEDKYVNSFDNLKLHAYSVKQKEKTSKWAIIVHGYGEDSKLMSIKALHFYEMGYNVLVPDLRGNGKSEGNYFGMGWNDRLDICKWIDTIIKEDPNSQISLYGVSMGASSILMASGENLPSNVKAIVSDCAYTSVYDVFGYNLKTYLNTPSFPIVNFTDLVTRIKCGYSLKDASAINQVKKSKIPILFIHGSSDKIVPPHMMNDLYNATKCDKEKLLIEYAEHGSADLVDPEAYWSKIKIFLNKYIN